MKTLTKLIVISILLMTVSVNAQNLFVENFKYPSADSLEGNGGWFRNGLNSQENIKLLSSGLIYPGYIGSGIGNAISMSNKANGDICCHAVRTQTSGSVYLSFLFRVDSLSANAYEGYNIALNPYNSTALNTRPYIRKVTSTTFNFGIQKLDSVPAYSPNIYNTNTTYLVVAKYTFVNGPNSNDSVKLFVFNSGVPATEPTIPTTFQVKGNDVSNFGLLDLTNSYAQNGLNGSSIKIDGIRVGLDWANTLINPVSLQLDLTVLMEGFYDSTQDKLTRDTVRVYLRNVNSSHNIVDSAKAFLDSAGYGSLTFSNASNDVPYYFAIKHRNSMEIWSGQAGTFQYSHYSADFIWGSWRTYGNNVIQVDAAPTKFAMYGGDINQDGIIDVSDILGVFNDVKNFVAGYTKTDITGDNYVDVSDLLITYNNAKANVIIVTP